MPEEVYYINGPETLPAPLCAEEEALVFAGLAAGRADCREVLITHNLRLVVYIAKKFENTGINIEDIISIGTIGLVKAVNTFAPEKNI
ncbi:MAG: sigma factor, partial [Pygmaiobacter sp.]